MKSSILILAIVLCLITELYCLNPYKTLGLSKYSSLKDVKTAYKKLAREFHPDKHQNSPNLESIKEKMRNINEAYEMIKKKKTVDYDYENDYDSVEYEYDEDEGSDYNETFTEKLSNFMIIIVIVGIIQKYIKFLSKAIYTGIYYIATISIFFYVSLQFYQKFFDHLFDLEDELYAAAFLSSVAISSVFTSFCNYNKEHIQFLIGDEYNSDIEDARNFLKRLIIG